jgi:EAL domain-containing protein (putative c-di-GMP-specific phosphodiesterase class I)
MALALAALIAWRNVQVDLGSAVGRAVFNADRILDRTVSDLERVDGLRGAPCDSATIRVLQDTVYRSLSQIREIGLIRDGRLYCTNFGATPKEIAIPPHLTRPGVHLELAANTVMVNNTSLFIYVARAQDRAVNAVFNPQVLAEFERDFPFSGYGRLRLSVEISKLDSAAGKLERVEVYSVGNLNPADAFRSLLTHRVNSARSSFSAEAEVSSRAWWRETLSLLPITASVFAVAGVFVFFAIRRWLARGNLDRLRYQGALQRNEFVMHYQPIVDAGSRQMVGMEALLRWQHPRRGLLRAAQFVDVFSYDALAVQLAHRVVELVIEDMKKIPTSHGLWCSINIAPTLLEDNRFLSELSHQTSAARGRIRLEITERAPLGEYAEVLLHELRSHGTKVGLDDLGTGYANLSQLQRMPFDFIKIDGMLVRGIQTLDSVSPVVKSLIALAREIGAEVVVEGVETKIQAESLIAAGATHLQGFYFDAARPIDEIVDHLGAQA